MITVTNVEAAILEALGRYKFLVTSQVVPLVGKSIGYVRTHLTRLAQHGLVKSFAMDKPGKAENMYYLTEAGKAVIIEHTQAFPDLIKLPTGSVFVVRDYQHRRAMIDVTIALTKMFEAAGLVILSSDSYFDKVGNNRGKGDKLLEAKIKIELQGGGFYIPDGAMLTEQDEATTIWLIEMFCDAQTTRVISQLHTHLLGAAQAAPGTKYGLRANPIILSVFQHENVMRNAIDKVSRLDDFKAFTDYLFFASLDELKTVPQTALKTMDGVMLDIRQPVKK